MNYELLFELHIICTQSANTISFNEALYNDLNCYYNINSGNFPMKLICGTK